MNSLPKRAQDVNPTAPKNNTKASAESTFTESVSDRSQPKKTKRHGFSKTLAELKNDKGEKLGCKASTLLRYLAYSSRAYGKNIHGKIIVRINLDHISEQYSYMLSVFHWQ